MPRVCPHEQERVTFVKNQRREPPSNPKSLITAMTTSYVRCPASGGKVRSQGGREACAGEASGHAGSLTLRFEGSHSPRKSEEPLSCGSPSKLACWCAPFSRFARRFPKESTCQPGLLGVAVFDQRFRWLSVAVFDQRLHGSGQIRIQISLEGHWLIVRTEDMPKLSVCFLPTTKRLGTNHV